MSVPPIGNAITPTNFLAVSAQGLVQLSWNAVPLVTIYYINRSTDNVTFTNIGSTVSLSYNDTTGTINTIYYYQIQSHSESSTSS